MLAAAAVEPAVAVAVVAAAATSLPLVSFPGLNSGNGANPPLDLTLPSPLLSVALRYLTTVVVVVAAVAALSRCALSLGLNPKDNFRPLATTDSSLSCAPTIIVGVVAAVAVFLL